MPMARSRGPRPVSLDFELHRLSTPPTSGEVVPALEVEDHLACLLSPQSFEADQYRVLRQFLTEARGARPLRILAVTSPAAGDGKTTTSINLAATLAQTPGSMHRFDFSPRGRVVGRGAARGSVDIAVDLGDDIADRRGGRRIGGGKFLAYR